MEPKGSSKAGMERAVHLPLSRAFEISLKSLKIRFARSIITAAGIFLGIAFLVSVLMQGVLKWPAPPDDIKTGLVRVDGEINAPGDYDAWKDVTTTELAQAGMPQDAIAYAAQGRDKFPLREFAEGVSYLQRADKVLPMARSWMGEFKNIPADRIATPKADGKFTKDELKKKYQMSADGVKRLLGTGDSIADKDLAAQYDSAKKSVDRWTKKRAELEIFRSVDKKKLSALQNQKAYTISEILAFAQKVTPKAAKNEVMIVNTSGRHLDAELEKKPKDAAIKVEQGDYVMVPDSASGYRNKWLVLMSLMVCTLGICNSMLMSVTERFKEIGTMKCLGALNRFVVTLFLLESMFMGLTASLLGWLVGFVAMILAAGFSKGWVAVGQMSIIDAIIVFGQALFVGALLTVIATIAPAIQAAKMPPAAALRVEI